jgi:RimJ/RimL family protein N-acetyltransferase
MLGIFERGTRVHVGIIRIDLDYAAGEALVNAIIGEPEHRNRGATTDAFVSTLDFLFDKEGMARVRASEAMAEVAPGFAGEQVAYF